MSNSLLGGLCRFSVIECRALVVGLDGNACVLRGISLGSSNYVAIEDNRRQAISRHDPEYHISIPFQQTLSAPLPLSLTVISTAILTNLYPLNSHDVIRAHT